MSGKILYERLVVVVAARSSCLNESNLSPNRRGSDSSVITFTWLEHTRPLNCLCGTREVCQARVTRPFIKYSIHRWYRSAATREYHLVLRPKLDLVGSTTPCHTTPARISDYFEARTTPAMLNFDIKRCDV